MVWANNRLYVCDTVQFKVFVYGPDGAQLGSFGAKGKGDSQFYGLQGIAVTPDGRVWVADIGTRIEVFEEVK